MGYDADYTIDYLMPEGWVPGAGSLNKRPDTPDPPDGCIEMWRREYTTHDWYPAKGSSEWGCLWVSSQYSQHERDELRAKASEDGRTLPLDKGSIRVHNRSYPS